MPKGVEFGSANIAREIRGDTRFKQFLAPTDDAREKTVRLSEDAPDMIVQDVRGEAADSKRISADSYGQVELSSDERGRIDFSKGRANVLHARSVKGIASGKGVDDWTSFYDPTLTVDEHKQVFERAKRDDNGARDEGAAEQRQTRRMAQAHQQVQEGRLGHAKDAAFQGDAEAQSFVREAPAGFDIGFTHSGGRLFGQGEDFDRLRDRHESRAERAQTLDEKQSAPVTRDPFQWVNAPAEFDYPGIDTVQPNELHEERSLHAQAVDEREQAPIADTKEQWAMHPDQFDWPGVDTPSAASEGDDGLFLDEETDESLF